MSQWIRTSTRARIYARDSYTCQYCGIKVRATRLTDHDAATLDHVLPRELGGSNEVSNLVCSCVSCNSTKRDLPLRAFLSTLEDPEGVAKRITNARRRQLPKL